MDAAGRFDAREWGDVSTTPATPSRAVVPPCIFGLQPRPEHVEYTTTGFEWTATWGSRPAG
jgi:hypothetical protein